MAEDGTDDAGTEPVETDASAGDAGPAEATATEASVEIEPGGRHLEAPETDSPLLAILFMVGLLGFVGSAIVLVVDLMTAQDPIRPAMINWASAAVLVGWAAQDRLGDPDSEVSTVGGALGTAALLLGIYLFVLGGILVATSFRHPRLTVGVAAVGTAVVLVVAGFLVFPREGVPEARSDGDDHGRETGENEDAPDPDGEE